MNIADLILEEFRLRLQKEGLSRIKKCVDLLNAEQVWYRHNENSNSVGNLIIHLSGNVRQYILAGMAGKEDSREREKEFSKEVHMSKNELVNLIEQTVDEAVESLQNLKDEDLLKWIDVQCYRMTGLSILVHVIEHFSYHVGQIAYFTKYIRDTETGFYAGQDLNATN